MDGITHGSTPLGKATTGATEWESFEINGEQYLAVANEINNAASYNQNSVIYKWDGSQFIQTQAIPTSGIRDWHSFKANGETYLAAANNYSGTSYNTNSFIYKWNAGTGQFDQLQTIATKAAQDWESFQIAGETYLAVANFGGVSGAQVANS
ncbi:MAG: hypothetical protein JKY92_07325, partial [Magnetovibrio sp.]|nr:hypothetical protein [Magnetovibrio sp.]